MKVKLLKVLVAVSIIAQFLVVPVKQSDAFVLTALGFGLAWSVKKTIIAGSLAVGGSTLYLSSQNQEEINEFTRALTLGAPLWVINDLANSYENARTLGSDVLRVSQEFLDWFYEQSATFLLGLFVDNNQTFDLSELRRFEDVNWGTANPTSPSWFNANLSNYLSFNGTADNRLAILLPPNNLNPMRYFNTTAPGISFARSGYAGGRNGNSIIGFYMSSSGTFVNNATNTLASLLGAPVMSRVGTSTGTLYNLWIPLRVYPGDTAPTIDEFFSELGLTFANPANGNHAHLPKNILLLERILPFNFAVRQQSLRERLEVFPAERRGVFEDIKDRNNGIPFDNAVNERVTSGDGFPIYHNRELGWVDNGGFPMTQEREREIVGFPTFPNVRDNVWDRPSTGTVPDVDVGTGGGTAVVPDVTVPEGATFLENIWNAIQSLVEFFPNAFNAVINAISNAISGVTGILADILNAVVSFFAIGTVDTDLIVDDIYLPEDFDFGLPWLDALLAHLTNWQRNMVDIFSFGGRFIGNVRSYFLNALNVSGSHVSHQIPLDVTWNFPVVGNLNLPFVNEHFLIALRETWRARIGGFFIIFTGISLVKKLSEMAERTAIS